MQYKVETVHDDSIKKEQKVRKMVPDRIPEEQPKPEPEKEKSKDDSMMWLLLGLVVVIGIMIFKNMNKDD